MSNNYLLSKKGHLFCKSCIVENLFHQKAEIKKSLKEWEESNKNRLLAENSMNDKLSVSKRQDLIVTVEDKIAHFEKNRDENVRDKNFNFSICFL